MELRSGGEHAFELAGADRKFVPATAKLENGALIVSSSQLSAPPLAVHYAWWSNPSPNLFLPGGLPASPFRSDNWPLETEPNTESAP